MSESDRAKDALISFLKATVLHDVEYKALWIATVVSQDPVSGTFDVKPDDADLPSMTGVVLRKPFPDMDIQVAPGARVLVGYEDGDPTKPICTLWKSGAPSTIRVGATSSIRLDSSVFLGSLLEAIHPLIRGDIQKAADTAFDTALSTADTPVKIAVPAQLALLAPVLVTINGVITASGPATPLPLTAGQWLLVIQALETTMSLLAAYTAALAAAGGTHSTALGNVLSTKNKTE